MVTSSTKLKKFHVRRHGLWLQKGNSKREIE